MFIFLFLTVVYAYSDAVLLKDIKVLTLHRGRLTTGRRSAPVDQITCVGGTASHKSGDIETVQCYNQGFNGRDYDWKCESQMDKSIQFGDIAVSCEGYNNPDDVYILAGSCGLEYSLNNAKQQPPPIPIVMTTTTTTTVEKERETRNVHLVKPVTITGPVIVEFFLFGGAIICFCLAMLFVSFLVHLCSRQTPRRPTTTTTYTREEPVVTRSRTSPIPYDEPRVRTTTTTYVEPVTIIQQPATIVIDRQPSYVSSAWSSPTWYNTPSYDHSEKICTSTTTVTTNNNSNSSSNDNTHVSTGYGGTKRR